MPWNVRLCFSPVGVTNADQMSRQGCGWSDMVLCMCPRRGTRSFWDLKKHKMKQNTESVFPSTLILGTSLLWDYGGGKSGL